MVNCAHPTHFASALEHDGAWRQRIGGLRANASAKSHAELDEATELDEGDPVELGAQHAALRDQLPASGCSAAVAAPTPATWPRSPRHGGQLGCRAIQRNTDTSLRKFRYLSDVGARPESIGSVT